MSFLTKYKYTTKSIGSYISAFLLSILLPEAIDLIYFTKAPKVLLIFSVSVVFIITGIGLFFAQQGLRNENVLVSIFLLLLGLLMALAYFFFLWGGGFLLIFS